MPEEGSDAQLKRVAEYDSVGWLVRAEEDRNALEEYKLSVIAGTRTPRRPEPGDEGSPEHDESPPADEAHDEYDAVPPA